MKRVVQLLLVVAVANLAFWLWTVFFPSPEKVIRSQLNALAKTASFDSRGGLISQALNAEKIGEFFTPDVDVEVTVPGFEGLSMHGRDEVQQAAAAARHRLTALKVEFVDMNVKLDPDGQGAKVNLTGNAKVPGEKEVSAQEFNFMLKKVDGKWLISHVETVKTLSFQGVEFSLVADES